MRRAVGAVALVLGLLLSACAAVASATPDAGPSARPQASATPNPLLAPTPLFTRTPSPTPTPTPADPLEGLSLAQRVGQLFMVGTPVERASKTTLRAVRDRHVGNVFLHGRSDAGAPAVAAVVGRFTDLVGPDTTGGLPLWVATDQEGGQVQVLRGKGFSDIPFAIRQADADDRALEKRAHRWGTQLRRAGVTMNLAPVADIVTSPKTRFDNAPIGAFGRQYGYDRQTIDEKAGAFARGMREAGILPTFKHFPGLGRVTDNTDTTRHVEDTAVRADSPDVRVYRDLTAEGPSVVMVSSAVYGRIDPRRPAMFSKVVIEDVLRGDVGFDGVVMTDDVSAARAVADIPPGRRAVAAISAGVDLVLVSADPTVLPEMYDAVLQRAKDDPAFADRVDEAARRIVEAKSGD